MVMLFSYFYAENDKWFLKKKAKSIFSTLVEFYEISHISISYGDLVYDGKVKLKQITELK